MPIYNNINTIFVRVPKTATTSICEKLYTADSFARYFSKVRNTSTTNKQTKELEKHETIRQIKDNIPVDDFNNYFKIGFVRNPWDWLVSYYSYYHENDHSKGVVLKNGILERGANKFGNISFKQFISIIEKEAGEYRTRKNLSQLKYPFQPQHKYLIDENERIIVDFVGKYENLDNDWNILTEKLDINNSYRSMKLERLNSTHDKDYKTYYDDADVERVYKIYKKDVDLFGYSF
jgi:hypothetical protein